MTDEMKTPEASESATATREPIPEGVYYLIEQDNFYNTKACGMGRDFHATWWKRRHEFPGRWDVFDSTNRWRDVVTARTAEEAIAIWAAPTNFYTAGFTAKQR